MDTISISSLQELHHSLVRSTYCGLIVLILRLPSWAGQILQRRQFEPPACGDACVLEVQLVGGGRSCLTYCVTSPCLHGSSYASETP